MYNHAPPEYVCPFCSLVDGNGDTHSRPDDIVYKNEFATAFIAAKWWVSNPGHVLVIPNEHYENIYDIPDNVLGEVYKLSKKVALAIRATYGCDGTSTRQHNEPAGDQVIWHLHVHVFPRYEGDQLYQSHNNKSYADAKSRAPYAKKLRRYFSRVN
jgi:histidine triad (HIT) family protein